MPGSETSWPVEGGRHVDLTAHVGKLSPGIVALGIQQLDKRYDIKNNRSSPY